MDRVSIADLLREVRLAQRLPESYAYLDGIAADVEAIGHELNSDSPDTARVKGRLAGLDRLVTDDYAFSDSPLGRKLLQFVDETAAEFDKRGGSTNLGQPEAHHRANSLRGKQAKGCGADRSER